MSEQVLNFRINIDYVLGGIIMKGKSYEKNTFWSIYIPGKYADTFYLMFTTAAIFKRY